MEWTVRTVAADLGVPPKKQQAGDLLKEIRRATAQGLPAHARIDDPQTLIDWTHAARDALNARHLPAHSAAVRQVSGPVLLHLRSGQVVPMEANVLMQSAQEIAKVSAEGNSLDFALRHEPRPGVYLPNTVLDGAWVPTCSTGHGGVDMPSPTQAELDEWWRTYGPFPHL